MSEGIVYRSIVLPNDVKAGDVLQIKFDTEGVVYDLFDNSMEELKEEYGYDFYSDIEELKPKQRSVTNKQRSELKEFTKDELIDYIEQLLSKIERLNQNKDDETD